MKLSAGNWKVSKVALGTVVADRFPIDFPQDQKHRHIKWYGGLCIAESIQNGGDAQLFAHSKRLLKVATDLRQLVNNFTLIKNEPAVMALNQLCNNQTTSTD